MKPNRIISPANLEQCGHLLAVHLNKYPQVNDEIEKPMCGCAELMYKISSTSSDYHNGLVSNDKIAAPPGNRRSEGDGDSF